jgi:NifB/MoaA-like Fe-S oxidoreductase
MPHIGELGNELLVPAVMLRYERDLFLDGLSVGDIENALKIKVKIVENNAADFIKAVYGG